MHPQFPGYKQQPVRVSRTHLHVPGLHTAQLLLQSLDLRVQPLQLRLFAGGQLGGEIGADFGTLAVDVLLALAAILLDTFRSFLLNTRMSEKDNAEVIDV